VRDRDGAVSGPGDTVTWRLVGTVLRRDAGGGAQPVAMGIRELAFTYLDGDGVRTDVPEAIRALVVRLVAEPDHARPPPGATVLTTLETTIRLRHR
jgi:hypothetical protein